jgi:chemotaxis family two-component system response regulator Rcp1
MIAPSMTTAAHHILIIDDNPGDLALTTEAFKECEFDAEFSYAMTGSDAIALLGRTGEFAHTDRPLPDLIILDLNLPNKNGLEVLAFIKSTAVLQKIPTVVLSTSGRISDIKQSYGLNANEYLIKPRRWSQLLTLIRPLRKFLDGPQPPVPAEMR